MSKGGDADPVGSVPLLVTAPDRGVRGAQEAHEQ
jgi:hypothetical protein